MIKKYKTKALNYLPNVTQALSPSGTRGQFQILSWGRYNSKRNLGCGLGLGLVCSSNVLSQVFLKTKLEQIF